MSAERHDYTILGTVPMPEAKAPMPPLLHALIKLAIVYAVIYVVCFAVDGSIR